MKTVWTVTREAEEQSPTLNHVGGKDFHDLYHVWHLISYFMTRILFFPYFGLLSTDRFIGCDRFAKYIKASSIITGQFKTGMYTHNAWTLIYLLSPCQTTEPCCYCLQIIRSLKGCKWAPDFMKLKGSSFKSKLRALRGQVNKEIK